jgi:prepilin-type processing-associated H-X9-DG protein
LKSTGWGTFLLNYLEQSALHAKYDFTIAHYMSAGNIGVVTTAVPTLRCPSSPVSERIYTYDFNYPPYPPLQWQGWAADYTPIRGVYADLQSLLAIPATTDLRGALVADVPTKIADISDGTSNTLLIAEISGRRQVWQRGKKVSDTNQWGGGWGDPTTGGFNLHGSDVGGTIAPGTTVINASNDSGLYSFHAAGANILHADGSVRLLSTSTSAAGVVALISRAAGDSTSE